MKKPNPSIRLREALPDDLPFLRSLALEAFSVYGDYETILTDFFVTDGVHTYVAEETRGRMAAPVGMLMMAVRKRKRREPYFAEILAIAVEQVHRGKGIGTLMIESAKQWPLRLSDKVFVPEIQLSVAGSNVKGRSFFERHGFEILRKEPWNYPAGQAAYRMRYVLETSNHGSEYVR